MLGVDLMQKPLPLTKRRSGIAVPIDFRSWFGRQEYCTRYSWAIPSPRAIRVLGTLSPLVEIGAGNGYWASLLTRAGADVIAYDTRPPHSPRHKNQYFEKKVRAFHPVRRGGPGRVRHHKKRTLFLCWPPYGDDMAYRALRDYEGDLVAYIGERGGCTADEQFEKLLAAEWEEIVYVDIPQWYGIHDALYVFRRRTKQPQ